MNAVLTCVTQLHDLRLVLAAALICVLSALAVFGAYRRGLNRQGRDRTPWIVLTALVGGAGVWATHFVAMLAYQPGLKVHYDFGLTALSLVVAVAGYFVAFSVATRRNSPRARLLGGALVGLSVAVMHFTGMAAVRLQADMVWNPPFVVTSVLLGMAGAAAALYIARDVMSWRRLALGAGVLVLAICSLHFTAMAAVELVFDPTAFVPPAVMERPLLAIAVGAIASLIVATAAALFWMERSGRHSALSGLRDALDGSPTGLGFFDHDQRLIFWNKGYADLLGVYGVKPQQGLLYASVLEAAVARGVLPAHEAMPGSDRRLVELRLPDGRWLRREAGATRDGGFVVATTDITEQKLAAQALADARDQAEAANRTKSAFLANMSHEIRTPLNGILGMAQVMARDPLDERQAERLSVIRTSGQTLLILLNDLLDISKIEAGRLELEEHVFDLEETIDAACAPFVALAADKGVPFRLELPAEVRGAWRGDGVRLRQVLSNLASNAVKFTVRGQVTLSVELAGGGLRFTVRDTGIGIPADRIPELWDKFSQVDSSTTRRFGGTGLGLAICRELSELMGGSLAVESEEGRGSAFSVELPLVRAEAASPPAAQPSPEPVSEPAAERGAALRILAAEDNAINQRILAALLEPHEVELTVVENGLQAVDAVATGDFDLILMDSQMPEMGGVEAAVEIRRLERERGLPRVPILALSANAMTHQVEEYYACGMDGFVAKPIEAAKLLAAISEALSAAPPRAAAAA